MVEPHTVETQINTIGYIPDIKIAVYFGQSKFDACWNF